MNINRNNYENFFLLYADGELNATEHLAVEEFIAANEDLRIELEMIQSAVLPTEEISLIDKSFLYKDITLENQLQQKLLLKLDNELSAAEIAKVNSILATNPSAKATYDLLEKTKLDANEKIIFEEKHLLYKKEKDNVVVFGFLRWAAAAVLVGIALFTGVKIYNSKKDTSGTIASNNGKTNKLDSNKIAKTSNGIKTDTNAVYKNALNGEISNSTKLVENNPSDYNVEIKNGKSKKEIENNITNKNSSKNFVTNSVNQRLTDTNKTTKELPLIENKFIAKEDAIIPKIENKIKEAVIENKNTIAVNSKASKNEITQSFKELEETYSKTATAYTEDKTDNKIFYMNEEKVKKSKVGGFFKKVKNMVERTANLKKGNSLQIAGFEIAAK